jgi:hypothetical protein
MAGGGGVASGVNRNELPSMAKRLSDPQLQQKLADQQTDPETMGIMQAESQRRVNTRKAVMAAGGGMIAFAKGGTDEVDNPFKDNPYPIREDIGAEKKPVTPTDKAKKKAESAAPKAKDMYSEYDEAVKTAGEGAFTKTKASMVEREKALPALQAEADKSIATRVADMRQTNKDLGIKDEHTKKLRDSFEQQIASSAEESKEEAKLRKAQAWAVFGSTPGPLLKVGLQALSGYIDDKIADESKRKKMQNELKKSLYELDRSSYLESVGMAKEAREHHLTAFNTVNNLRDKIADDRRALETKDYEFKKGAAETKLKAKEREQERKLTLEAARITKGGNLNEEKLETKQTQLARAALEAFDKGKDGEKLSNYESMKSLAPEGFKAVEADYNRLKKKQDDLKIALKESYSRAKGLDATPAPSAAPSAADISFTAKKYGITEDEVKKRLGVK